MRCIFSFIIYIVLCKINIKNSKIRNVIEATPFSHLISHTISFWIFPYQYKILKVVQNFNGKIKKSKRFIINHQNDILIKFD